MEDDQKLYLMKESGEIITEVPVGTSWITPEQRKKKKERQEHEKNRYRARQERYIFINMLCQFEELKPSTVTELIYLSTYTDYDGVLKTYKKQDIKKCNLQSILKVSEQRARDFWKEVSPAYITENETGQLVMNQEIFRRGELNGKEGIDYQQFYFKGVRALYKGAQGKHHKQIGQLFKLLPYINREWNVLCKDPFEEDLEEAGLISMLDFCALTGKTGDVSHISRLKKSYDSIKFVVSDKEQRFCTIIYDGVDECSAKICVNPNVCYAGSNDNKDTVLTSFFRE